MISIVYHDNCHDGIMALWVCLQKFPDAEQYPARHDVTPDLDRLRGRDVVMVDFSWKRDAMESVIGVAHSLLVLDHHKTAKAELDGINDPRAEIMFDMGRSGAGLAWDRLNPGQPRPWLVNYVEDRDLWRFSLPRCRAVHAYCNSYPLTIEARHELMMQAIERPPGWFADNGDGILRYHDKLVASAVTQATGCLVGDDLWIPAAVVCPCVELVSDIGQALAVGRPFAAAMIPQPDGSLTVSLRSAPDGADVSEIARQMGGGGHKHAAGFSLPAGRQPEWFDGRDG